MRMRIPARLGLAVSFAAIAITAACSDSSGPGNEDTAAKVAAHFDSIYVDAAARADTESDAYSARVELATLLELPAALGSVPTSLTVTTASGAEQWKAYEFEELNPAATDSVFVLLAYREAAAHTVLLVFFDSTGTGYQGGVITNDTLNFNPSHATASTTLSTVGTTCATPSASLKNPEFDHPFYASCSLATFRTTTALSFSLPGGVDPALASLSFPFTKLGGLKVTDVSEEGRVQKSLHALRARLSKM
jgi:hypothetical protein